MVGWFIMGIAGKKFLVTGGSGFIGSNLVDQLSEMDDGIHEVTVIDISDKNENPYAKYHYIDLNSPEHTVDLYEGIDCVFHVASQARVQPSIKSPVHSVTTNISSTAKVLEFSRQAGVKRVVYSMTSSIYGAHPTPHTEDLPPQPLSPYAVSKLSGEQLCKVYSNLYNLDTVSLRYFNVYGFREPEVGEYATVVRKFLRQHKANLPIPIVGDGEQRRDFTNVADVVSANILAMEHQDSFNGEIFNIGTGINYSINEIANMISESRTYLPDRPGEARETLADNSKAKTVLGWHPSHSLEDYIKKSL
jgi:UDP-glucose 4-epimerase